MMKPKKPFHKLRGRMYENGVTQEDISEHLGRSKSYFAQRFNCYKPFTLFDVYGICNMLDISEKEVHIYFPKNDVMG